MRHEKLKELPEIGDEVSFDGSLIGISNKRITGVVIDRYWFKRLYILEVTGKAGKFKVCLKAGGQSRTDYRRSPHPAYVRSFRKNKT